MPGGHQVDWLAAGTYDRSVGLSLFTLQVTHKIDEDTDVERNYIVQTVTKSSPIVTVTNLKDFSTGYHSRNAYGDSIQTDGDLPVLELGHVPATQAAEVERHDVILDGTTHDEDWSERHDTLLQELWSRRPPQISFGIILTVIAALISLMNLVIDVMGWELYHQETVQAFLADGWPMAESLIGAKWLIGGAIVLTACWIVLTLGLAWRTFCGSDRSRQILMMSAAVAAVGSSWSLTIGKLTWITAGLLAFIGINIVTIIMLSSDAARKFTRTRSSYRS